MLVRLILVNAIFPEHHNGNLVSDTNGVDHEDQRSKSSFSLGQLKGWLGISGCYKTSMRPNLCWLRFPVLVLEIQGPACFLTVPAEPTDDHLGQVCSADQKLEDMICGKSVPSRDGGMLKQGG